MKRTMIIVALCITLSIALMVWGFQESDGAGAQKAQRYALLTTLDRGTVVMQLKQGAQTAADALGVELAVYTTDEESDPDAQLVAQVTGLAGADIDGIILPPCGEEALAAILQIVQAENMPLLCLWMEEPAADAYVVTDYQAQGRLLAEAAGHADAILAGNDAQSEQRVAGIRAVLGENVPHMESVEAVLGKVQAGGTVLVADPALTSLFAEQAGERYHVWGVDPGEARVALLENGLVRGLVMEMPYVQGYEAIALLHAVRLQENGTRRLYTQSRIVIPETMYSAENVKLVFPLLQ